MDRRDFLTASLAVPLAGAQGGSKIRTGILGIQHGHLTGKVGAMRNNPAYELVAVCEPDPATRRDRGDIEVLRGLPHVSLDEMLADTSIDLIVFEGEVKDAIPYGRRIIEAGKHLHLEKPPTDEMKPFEDLVALAEEKGRLLQLGYLWRFHDGFERVREALENGWMGEVFLGRATINSDRDAKQRAVEARYPGGTMFELGGHMIDLVVGLFGRPRSVRSWLRHDTSEPDELRDNTLAVFEYERALAVVSSAAKMGGAIQHRSFEVLGTDGSIMVQPMEPRPVLRVYMRRPHGPYRAGWQEVQLDSQPRYIKDFEELARAIVDRRPLRYSYEHELALHETLLRASNEL